MEELFANVFAEGVGCADAWQRMETEFDDSEIVGEWRLPPMVMPLSWLELVENETHTDKRVTPEIAHLAAQILRIPKRHACTQQSVLQVAFNAGQLVGAIDKLRRDGKPMCFALDLFHTVYTDDPSWLVM